MGDQPPEKAAEDKPHYHGHRARLRERFRESPHSLPDYEYLELLLFQANERKDTKPLAKRLLAGFDEDLGRLANASDAEIENIVALEKGFNAERVVVAIRQIGEGASRLLRSQVMQRPVLGSWTQLIDYLNVAQADRGTEQFRLLFLDAKNRLIREEVQQTGTIDETPVYPREVAKRALELRAAALIVVHNHPSGDTTPSRADIAITREIAAALKALDIALHDHIIVGRGHHASFRALGLL